MEHLKYVLKIAVVTGFLIMLMQVKVDNGTLENYAEKFIRTSSITSIFRDTAQGGFLVAKDVYHASAKAVDSFFTRNFRNENSPGRRKLMEVKRSLGFNKEHEKRLEQLNAQDVQ